MVKKFIVFLLLSIVLFASVNINKANSAQLETLNGIGPTKAKEIMKYRKTNGGFKSVDDLLNVKGIGPKTLENMRNQVAVE